MRCPRCNVDASPFSPACPQCGAPLASEEAAQQTQSLGSGSPEHFGEGRTFVGGYRIIRELGRGGMGTVYEAEQQNPRRPVALKVIQGGAVVNQAHVRLFQRESQALARMKHPNIAAIYEAGCTEDGKHFFAMELVRGATLRDYLDRVHGAGRLTSAEIAFRIALARKICDAVNYAHQRGIIHRDLKPANVLVAESGGPLLADGATVPEVKILDFGLARITDADIAPSAAVSVAGEIFGTVPYMSPEQIRGNTDEIDVRTDVYALGVMLYEMLTGHLPLDLARSSLPRAARIICDERPAPLSSGWLGPGKPPGDLQTIVSKAMEKRPSSRYPSVAAMSEDLERFLRRQPVLARAPSTAYQLRKMVARHRIGFTFATILLVLLVGFGIAMGLLSRRLASAKDRAEREAARATAINAFLLDTLGSANPVEGRARDVTVLETLRDATRKLDTAFVGQPEVDAIVRHTIALTYLRLGEYEDAEPLFRDAVKTWRSHFGSGRAELIEPLTNLGVLRQERGDLGEAEAIYREALALSQRLHPVPGQERMDIMNNLALLLQEKGDLAGAETLVRDILEIERRTLGPAHPNVAVDLNNLGNILKQRERLAESESLFREAIAICEPTDFPGLPVMLGNLGEVLTLRGEAAQAEPILARALQSALDRFGEKNQDAAKIRVKYAACLAKLGRYGQAESHAIEGLRLLSETLGEQHEATRRAARVRSEIQQARIPPGQAPHPLHENHP